MACCGRGRSSSSEVAEKRRSDRITTRMRQDLEKESSVMKLLLLGPGESGKSTIFKQANALFNNGYQEEERRRFREIVFNNLYLGFKALVAETDKGHEPCRLRSEQARLAREAVEKVEYHDCLTVGLVEQLETLWRDAGVQNTWERRAQFQLPYPLDYFMGKVHELAKTDYVPSKEDVLRCRVRTTGIVELEFRIEQSKFVIMDVGGQRNERKKWMHCFDRVTAVIFVAAISEYDQILYEDEKTNRLQEALDVFGEIANLKFFTNTSIILFLNKTDLFAEKIKRVPLSECFKDYFGSMEFGAAANFIKDKFLSKADTSRKKIFTHLTCATDSELIKKVFLDVRDIVLRREVDNQDLLN